VSTSFGPTTSDSFAAGLYHGQPGDMEPRRTFVALAADESLNGAGAAVSLRVYFVPSDFGGGRAAEEHDVSLTGSQQVTVSPSVLTGELFVRVQHLGGASYFGRAYSEFV
jgi:hypothetical protein